MVTTLVPGRLYNISGREGGDHCPSPIPNADEYSGQGMYVRQERIRGEEWDVFAALHENNNMLLRVRVPHNERAVVGTEVRSHRVIEHLVVFDRNDECRSLSVNRFLDRAAEIVPEAAVLDVLGLVEVILRNAA